MAFGLVSLYEAGMSDEAKRILRRTGWVLIAAGLLGIGVTAQLPGSGFQLHLIVPACIIGGIFLLRGSLRAVTIILWLTTFDLTLGAFGLVAKALMRPIGLTFTELRLEPGTHLWPVVQQVAYMVVSAWVIRELRRAPVRAAYAAAGRRFVPLSEPAGCGIALVILAGIIFVIGLDRAAAAQARQAASTQLGPDYSYYVSSMNVVPGYGRRIVSAVVVAWNASDIRSVAVSWEETTR
jgi:hypothetical protein